nr:unnamed protein product [Callosobruchus chinensis]
MDFCSKQTVVINLKFFHDKCRVCKRVFCCTSCRDVHEISKHDFFVDCDICKYGQTILSSISTYSEVLLGHLKTAHFPLRCDLCKRTFNTIDDVFQHMKCPEANKVQAKDDGKSPKTPAQIFHDSNFDSPPLTNLLIGKNLIDNKNIKAIVSLATSTPMQHSGGNLEKVQEVIITPVESTENTKNSILKNPNSQCNSFKRVTFYGTPFIENSQRKPKNMVMAGASIGMSLLLTIFISTGVMSPSKFYSAKPEQTTNLHSPSVLVKTNEIIVEEIKPEEDPNNDEKKPKEVLDTTYEREDNTVWISALNISVEICSDDDEHGGNEEDKVDEEQDDKEQIIEDDEKLPGIPKTNFVTPSTSKVTSRKISIVKPTPAKKEKKEEQLFVDMIQTYSTPNVPRTIQPSAPSMLSHADPNPPISTIYGESTSNAVSIIDPNSSAATANEVINQESAQFEDSVVKSNETGLSKSNTIWASVSNILSNIFHNFSGVDASYQDRATRSLKRCSSDNDLLEPLRKKHKLTDIKCRRPIRDLPPLGISNDLQINIRVNITEGTKKIYVDKATITDEWLFSNQ